MTEHKKIPLPHGDKPKESSLLERATGAFGLDPFGAAPFKGKLPDPPMKRAKVRKKAKEAEEKAKAEAEAAIAAAVAAPAPVAATATSLPATIEGAVDTGQANLPAVRAPSEIVLDQGRTPVVFSGRKIAVDREHLREQGMIVPEGTVTALMEEFRIVKRQLIATARERGTALSRRVLICSPHPGEGKTFCATNLAIAMAAERDSEVLLIDADLAKPSILSTLGLPKGPGLMDCLADDKVNPEDLVIGTDIPGLWVLPAGNQTNSDSEYLASARTDEVLDRLTFGAPNRVIIFDTPPALAASPAAELAKHVGQTVLVARADKTGQNALEDAYQLLSACPDIKLLLNAAQFSPSGRKFGSYYGYGG